MASPWDITDDFEGTTPIYGYEVHADGSGSNFGGSAGTGGLVPGSGAPAGGLVPGSGAVPGGASPGFTFPFSGQDRNGRPLLHDYGATPGNGQIDTGIHSFQDPSGFGSTLAVSGTVFPSLGNDGARSDRDAARYMSGLVKSLRSKAASASPEDAAFMLADINSLKSGYRNMLASGMGARDAAYAAGLAGSVFGGYANVGENARYLSDFARDRGTGIQDAAREFREHRNMFAAHYLTAVGVPRAGENSTHNDAVTRGFSQVVGAMKSVENQYSWRFDRGTYSSVMRSAARIAGELTGTGMTIDDVGADNVVRAALAECGAMGASASNPVTGLSEKRVTDRNLVSLFGPQGPSDSVVNPNNASGAPVDSQEYGMVAGIRHALFGHRARSVRSGLGPDNFDDVTQLRSDISRNLRMFSTSASKVSDDTFGMVSDFIIRAVRDGNPVSVVDAARAVAGAVPEAEAEGLARWSRSLVMDSPAGYKRMQEGMHALMSSFASAAGLPKNHPDTAAMAARMYRLFRRRYLDRKTVSDLEGVEREAAGMGYVARGTDPATGAPATDRGGKPVFTVAGTDEDLDKDVRDEFTRWAGVLSERVKMKNDMAYERALSAKRGAAAAEEDQ